MLGLIYNATIPLFEPPDEIWHFAFADHLAKGGGLPVLSMTKSAFLREGGQPPLYYALVALVVLPFDRSDFPNWVRFNASHPAITPGATSDTPNVFIHTTREDWPWTGSVLAVHIARLVSLVFGALTVIGIYRVGRMTTGRDDLAALSAALIAFTPQFVFICASVNNDSLAAATSVWIGVAALQILNLNYRISKRSAIALGLLLGAGLLAKLGGLVLIPLIALAFFIRGIQQRSNLKFEIWHLILMALILLSIASLVSGWWFARNIVLYGDPLGWSVWLSDIGVRTPTPALWQLIPELPALFRTYWAELPGYSLSDTLFWLLLAITALALTGIIKPLLSLSQPLPPASLSVSPTLASRSFVLRLWSFVFRPSSLISHPFLFHFLWFGIVLAGVLRYMQTTPAAQGRLLFPALAPIGVMLVCGLSAWGKRPWLAVSVAGGLLALTLIAPWALVRPAFARPIVTQLPADVRPTQTQFGDRVELIGVRFPDHVEPGGTLQMTTYWRALKEMPRDQRLLIRLMRPNGASGGQLDARLGTHLYPTTLWRPGQIVVDTHVVRADADLPAPLTMHVHLGVGDELEPLLPVTGESAWATGDVADVGQVQVKR